jgi:CMP-N-acetylneuraminic acid synthetase
MKNLALIPARGGSKGIKGKNLTLLADKPLIAYTIKAALESKCFDRIIVSTDSEDIGLLATQLGAEVPFLRPSEFATDDASDFVVVKHALYWLESNNQTYDIVAYLRPTAPFRPINSFTNAIKLLEDNLNADSIRSVTKVEGVHHPYWMYKSSESFLTEFVDGIRIQDYYQRQLLPECLRLNGVIDMFRAENLSKYNNMYGKNILPFPLEGKFSIDIDTVEDLRYAEFILKSELL